MATYLIALIKIIPLLSEGNLKRLYRLAEYLYIYREAGSGKAVQHEKG